MAIVKPHSIENNLIIVFLLVKMYYRIDFLYFIQWWDGLSINTIAVTGANGFLGRHCIKKALKMDVNVKGIVRRKEAADTVEELGAESIIVKNFCAKAYLRAFDGCDGILHLIGIVNERYSTFQDINVHGTRIVLESALKSQVSRFVTPSGLGVGKYGERPWATNDYFWSKRKIEMLCQSSPVSCVVFRPSLTFWVLEMN